VTEAIAGTEIVTATDDAREQTILVSDLHIPSDGGPVFEMFRRLLDTAAASPSTRLVVLGDMFDAYTGPKQARVGVWRDTVEALAAAAAAGVSITILHGNRDFMLDDTFGRAARCRVVSGGIWIKLGNRRCLLLHGDELCQRDLPYQRAKRMLRNKVTRAVLRHLPLRLALYLAERARNKSASVIASGDQTRFDPVASALSEVFAGGADLLVFGHIHRPARGWLGAAGNHEYAILPAFDTDGVHLVWNGEQLRFRAVDGREIADYPPREFR
jgi:UDP-2,3-diacylglucosamine hydrolase